MDEKTRKQLEMHYRILLKEASVIRAILDGDNGQIVKPAELKGANVASAGGRGAPAT